MTETGLEHIRIVLVEPAGPRNVGAIARVMKNMDLHQLVLVNPQCDPLGPEARQMAVHANDRLESAQVVASLPEALQGCQRAIATTARQRSLTTELEPPQVALPWLLETVPQRLAGAVIFGPEDRGLSNAELNYAQRFVAIPSSPTYPSLNLAQAVGICCYELYQAVQAQATAAPTVDRQAAPKLAIDAVTAPLSDPLPLIQPAPQTIAPPAPLDQLESYYQQLETVLLKVGYLYPHTAESRMQKFRRLYNRAAPSNDELAMLRGILSQFEWALQNAQAPISMKSDNISPNDH